MGGLYPIHPKITSKISKQPKLLDNLETPDHHSAALDEVKMPLGVLQGGDQLGEKLSAWSYTDSV